MLRSLLVWLSFAVAFISSARAAPSDEVGAATQAWADAFNSRDTERIVALYDAGAVLWGTSSPTLRDTPEKIRAYFSNVPPRPNLRVAFGEQHVRVFGEIAINTGAYTFSNTVDGRTRSTPARFSLTYRLRHGRWLIVDHHSSVVPPAKP